MSFPKIKGLRWWIMGLLMLGSVLNYLTRSTLSVAAPTLKHTLHISDGQYGSIVNAFQLALMLQPFSGYVLDGVGLKIGFALFVIAWSVITVSHGLVQNWRSFIWLRGLMGLAEGSANPAGMKATAEWFPAKERGLAGGFFNIGASVGSMLAPPLVAWAILNYNWQTAFVITGGMGFIWVILWLGLYNSPKTHPALTEGERQRILGGQEKHLEESGRRPSILGIVKQRNFWGIALPRLLADPTWGTLTAWLPLYFHDALGFDLKTIAVTAWLPFLAADFGCMFGGTLVLALQKRGIGLINARRGAFTVGACLMTGMALVGFTKNPYFIVALLCLGGFAHQTLSVTAITMSSDLFRRSEVATVAGLAGTCGNLGIIVFNLLLVRLIQGTGQAHTTGYAHVFICLGFLDLVGAAVLWTFVREKKTDQTRDEGSDLTRWREDAKQG